MRDFKISFNNNVLEVTNTSDKYFENCLVSLKNIFFDDVVNDVTTFQPNEIKTFNLTNRDFMHYWSNKEFFLKIYSNQRLILDKKLNDKSRCFVLISNQKFEDLTGKLIIGLNNYSDIDILHYTIGYDTKLNYDNLNNIRLDIERNTENGTYIQFTKPTVFLDVLSKGYQTCVFLDSDIQVRDNIDGIFDYSKHITDAPILQRGCHDYAAVNGKYTPGELTSELLGITGQTSPYCLTNVVIFNQSQKSLFEEWKSVCDLKEVESICENEFLHDEILLNCVMWKNNISPKLFWFFINVKDSEDVKFFLEYTYNGYESLVDMNEHSKGFAFQSKFPYDKNNIFGFHCIKDLTEVDKVNSIISKVNNTFDEKLLDFYKEIPKTEVRLNPSFDSVNFLNHFIDGALMEVRSKEDKEFRVEFWSKSGICEFVTNIRSNMWTKTNKKYFDEWTCKVYDGDHLIYDKKYDATGKRVFITLESKSIGDTLAWFPYVDEFRKKWNCKVICSTFWNHLFIDTYPEIEFVNPGSVVNNIYAMYSVGWFYNDDDTFKVDRNPSDFKEIPLGKTAADILGLDFEYVKAKINIPAVEKQKRVGIAIHSTAQTKYWNNPTGWQEVTDYLIGLGYEVLILSKEGDGYMGNSHPKGANKLPEGSMENLMKVMKTCEFFIGVGSGLSWVSWTLNVPTVLISGFSKPISEFSGDDVIRIFNSSVCNGCYNRFRLDAGDWNWCPDQKGTERQFECTKSITGKMVIDAIKSKGWVKELETQDYIL